MAHSTQARQLGRITFDADRLSGQYFGWGALIATVRIFWVIALTAGLFGTPADPLFQTVGDLLGSFLWAYAAVGLMGLLATLYSRPRSEEPISSTRLFINYLGVIFFLALSVRVASVVQADPARYPITLWGLQLVNGLVLGGVYALVALGYTLVYGIMFMINFAHGEVLVMGTFGGWFALTYVNNLGDGTFEVGAASVATVLLPLLFAVLFLPLETLAARAGRKHTARAAEPDPTWLLTLFSLPVRFLIGALVGYGLLQAMGGFAPHVYEVVTTVVALLFVVAMGMIASTLVAIVLERVAYRPLRTAPRLAPLISAIGASFFLQQAMLNVFGPAKRAYSRPRLIDGTIDVRIGDLGTIPVTKTGIIVVIVSVVLMVLLYTFVQRSKTGRAMRAVAEDKPTSALMGVDVNQVIVITFAVGALLAGAAGVMMGFHNQSFNFRAGFIPGLKAFTAAVLGGIGNIPGAMFGGFFLGLVEALGPTMLGINAEYKDVIAFSLLVLVLVFRPTGIFGEVLAEKKV
ncbi:MAG: branched-chain amino acid ABC transporter permease [Anaerolineae bacterium]|nr:branched-chain amino acid ABC transporter permease [Anaerolineae bacterium]